MRGQVAPSGIQGTALNLQALDDNPLRAQIAATFPGDHAGMGIFDH